ncbi:MAG: hypothetical protein ABI216_21600 [Devosia sp.]
MSAHTPGPWQLKNDYDGRTTVIANVDGETFADGTSSSSYDFVCDTYRDGDDDSRSMAIAIANARLIAAAPALLAALQSFIPELEQRERFISANDSAWSQSERDMLDRIWAARKAVRDATGEAA